MASEIHLGKMAGNLIFHDGVAESIMYTQTHVQSGRSLLQAKSRPSIRHARNCRREDPLDHPRSVQVEAFHTRRASR